MVLFEALQKQASSLSKDLSDEQKEAIKGAYKKLGYEQYIEKLESNINVQQECMPRITPWLNEMKDEFFV